MPCSLSFLRSVLRLMPRSCAARTWLLLVSRMTARRSGFSTRPTMRPWRLAEAWPRMPRTHSTIFRSMISSRGVGGHAGRGRDGPDGQVLGQDDTARGHDHRALDHVLQLAHVAWPLVAHEPVHGVGSDHPLAQRLEVFREEMLDEERNVAAALAQRGQRQRHHVETVEQ